MGCAREVVDHDQIDTGLGLVADDEILAFAVFDEDGSMGETASPTAFKSKSLKRGDLSLARLRHTNLGTFRDRVVKPKNDNGQVFRGVVVASALELRNKKVSLDQPKIEMRAVCVLNKVEVGDIPGHAALQFCQSQDGLTEPQRARIRAVIAAELVELFGAVRPIEMVFPDEV